MCIKILHSTGVNVLCCVSVYYRTLSSTQTRTKSLTDAHSLQVYSRHCASETPALHSEKYSSTQEGTNSRSVDRLLSTCVREIHCLFDYPAPAMRARRCIMMIYEALQWHKTEDARCDNKGCSWWRRVIRLLFLSNTSPFMLSCLLKYSDYLTSSSAIFHCLVWLP